LRLNGILRARGPGSSEPRPSECAGGSADSSAAATADRPAEPGPEHRCQCRRAEPAQIGTPHLVAYRLLRETPADGSIVLEVCERFPGTGQDLNSRHDRCLGARREQDSKD